MAGGCIEIRGRPEGNEVDPEGKEEGIPVQVLGANPKLIFLSLHPSRGFSGGRG